MEEPELTEQQKTALRKAIGDIIGLLDNELAQRLS